MDWLDWLDLWKGGRWWWEGEGEGEGEGGEEEEGGGGGGGGGGRGRSEDGGLGKGTMRRSRDESTNPLQSVVSAWQTFHRRLRTVPFGLSYIVC